MTGVCPEYGEQGKLTPCDTFNGFERRIIKDTPLATRRFGDFLDSLGHAPYSPCLDLNAVKSSFRHY